MRVIVLMVLALAVASAAGASAGAGAGRTVVFEHDSGLVLMRPDGTGMRHIPHTKANDDHPVWSPDGRWIAFQEFHAGAGDRICLIRPDGTARHCLVWVASDRGWPTWSPDGTRLAYDDVRNGNADVWVVGLDGRQPRRLTFAPSWDEYPSWTKDGLILYDTGRPDLGWQHAELLDPRTGRTRRLAPVNRNQWNASLSPDGTKLAYTSGDEQLDLYVTTLATHETRRLTSSSAWDGDAAWSPDSRRLLFNSGRRGNDELYLADTETGAQQRVTRLPRGNACCASWRG